MSLWEALETRIPFIILGVAIFALAISFPTTFGLFPLSTIGPSPTYYAYFVFNTQPGYVGYGLETGGWQLPNNITPQVPTPINPPLPPGYGAGYYFVTDINGNVFGDAYSVLPYTFGSPSAASLYALNNLDKFRITLLTETSTTTLISTSTTMTSVTVTNTTTMTTTITNNIPVNRGGFNFGMLIGMLVTSFGLFSGKRR